MKTETRKALEDRATRFILDAKRVVCEGQKPICKRELSRNGSGW